MVPYSEVKCVHLEVTTRCNASCPMCARNVSGGRVNPYLPVAELSLDDVRRILPADLVRRLDHVYLCGNYGEPIVAADALPILRHLRDSSSALRLGVLTNGSARSAAWWSELAGVVSYVQFGIDGLEDTNHLHRRGTSWAHLMSNAAAFIAAGGNAEWEMIVFEHNEAQVEEACRLAREMGFRAFRTRLTNRFFRGGRYQEEHPVLDEDGGRLYALRPPKRPELLNPAVAQLKTRVESGEEHLRYLDATKIECAAIADRKIYISAEGLVFPCCYTGHIYPWREFPNNQTWRTLEAHGGKDAIDARRRPLDEILGGPLFRTVRESWTLPSIAAGKYSVCAALCGQHPTVQSQYTTSKI